MNPRLEKATPPGNKPLLAFLSGWFSGGVTGQPHVCCPRCDEEYVHFLGVELSASNGLPVTVRSVWQEDDPRVGVTVFSQFGPMEPSSRRGAVMLVFEGESCRHRFGLTFAQHKGNEFVYLADLGDSPEVSW